MYIFIYVQIRTYIHIYIYIHVHICVCVAQSILYVYIYVYNVKKHDEILETAQWDRLRYDAVGYQIIKKKSGDRICCAVPGHVS